MTTANIAIIGECMLELSEKNGQTTRSFGGDTLNTAVYMTRLLPKEKFNIHYVTALGTDPFSENMIAAWKEEGIKTELIQQLDNKLPGLYMIVTDEHGERSFFYWRSDAAAKFWLKTEKSAAICQKVEHFDYVYLSGISIAILDDDSLAKLNQLLRKVKENGGKIIFDNNYRPRLWASKEKAQQVYSNILSHTDIAFLTLDDEDLLWGKMSVEDVVSRTKGFGVTEIVIKRGSDTCLVDAREGTCEVPANKLSKEQVVDTTAAGDSFSAGYLSARLNGCTAEESAKQGHLVAGTVIQHRGAIIPLAAMPK